MKTWLESLDFLDAVVPGLADAMDNLVVADDFAKAKFASRSEAGKYAAHIRWSRENGVEPLTPEQWRARQTGTPVVEQRPVVQPAETALDRARRILADPATRQLIADAVALGTRKTVDANAYPSYSDAIADMTPGMVTQTPNSYRFAVTNDLRMNAGAVKLIEDVETVGRAVLDVVNERVIAEFGTTDILAVVQGREEEIKTQMGQIEERLQRWSYRVGPESKADWEKRVFGEEYAAAMMEYRQTDSTAAYQRARDIANRVKREYEIAEYGEDQTKKYSLLHEERMNVKNDVKAKYANIVRGVLKELVPMGDETPLVHGSLADKFKKIVADAIPSSLIREVNESAKARRANGKGILLTKSTGGGHWQRVSTVGKNVGPKILHDGTEETIIHEFHHAMVEYSPMFAALDNLAWNYRRMNAQKADRSTTSYVDRANLPQETLAKGIVPSANRLVDELKDSYSGNRYTDGLLFPGFFSGHNIPYPWNNSELSTVNSSMLSSDRFRPGSFTDPQMTAMYLGSLVLAGSR